MKLRKLLIWTFIAAIFSGGVLGIFSFPQKAKAINDRGWSMVLDSKLQQLRIQHGTSDANKLLFAQQGGYGQMWISTRFKAHDRTFTDEDALLWNAVGADINPKLYVVTDKAAGDGLKDYKGDVITSGTAEIRTLCMDRAPIDAIGAGGFADLWYMDKVDVSGGAAGDFYCFMGDDPNDYTSLDWFNTNFPKLYPDANVREKLLSAIRSVLPDFIVRVEYKRPGAPQSDNLKACESTIVQPLYKNSSDAEMETNIQKMKEAIANDPANKDDQNVINGYFSDPDLKNRLKNYDKDIYSTFYSTNGKYPNVTLTKNLQSIMAGDFNKISAFQPLSNDPDKWRLQPLDDSAAILAGYIGGTVTGNNVKVGVVVGAATLYGIGAAQGKLLTWQATDEFKKALEAYVKVSMEAYYLIANNNFNQCLANKGDSWAYVNDKIARAANSLAQQATDIGKNTNTDKAETCGLPITQITSTAYWIAKALCGVLNFIADIAEMLINSLFKSVFNAYHPPNNFKLSFLTADFIIPQAHAESGSVSPLIEAFTNQTGDWGWVVTVWKFVLTLTDLFLVVILLFLGIVNILHIQYDTYAIKKMLPLLIIGVILANFSLLIMRMLIDASNILTKSFMDGDPGTAVGNLIRNFGLSQNQLPEFASSWQSVGGLFLGLIFSFFAIAAFLILGVMFYIRYAVIIILGIAAPLAFVAMAFPPTQSLFKQWWSWTTKFVFMKPIAMFFIMVATQMKGEGAATGITGWIIITALVYMAIIVPWKLGGAVMAAWGGAMGSLFGTKKGGWARKPVDDYIDRRKRAAGTFIKGLPGIRDMVAAGKADEMETAAKQKLFESENEKRARDRKGGRATNWEARSMEAENALKNLVNKQLSAYRTGEANIGLMTRLRMAGLKWEGGRLKIPTSTDFGGRLADSEADLLLSEADLEKAKQDTFSRAITRVGRENDDLKETLGEKAKNGNGMQRFHINDDGMRELEEGEDMTWRDYMNTASRLHEMATTEKDARKKANLISTANKLESEADDFAKSNPLTTKDGRNLYDSFMNQRYAGRIMSVLTKLYLDEVQVNQLNETPETMVTRAEKDGFGPRNIKGKKKHLQALARGKYSELDIDGAISGVQEWKTWMENISRRGSGDRGREFANFLKLIDDGNTFNPTNDPTRASEFKGNLMRNLLQKAEELRPGSTADFLAEAISDASNRRATLPGFEKLKGRTFEEGKDLITAAEAEGINIKESVATNAENIFGQIDLTPTAQNRAKIAFMNEVADLTSQMENFCGAGNLVGYTLKTRDKSPDDWFESLAPKVGPSPEAQESNQVRRQTEEHQEQAASSFADTDPNTVQNADKALQTFSTSVLPAIKTKIQNLNSAFQINGQPVSGPDLERLIEAISSSDAPNLQGLVDQLTQKLGVNVTASTNLKLDDEASSFIQDARTVSGCTKNARTLIDKQETTIAEDVYQHTPEKAKDASPEDLQKSIDGLQEAANSLSGAMETLSKSSDPNEKLNNQLIKGLIEKIGAEKPTVKLTAESLQDPFKLSETMNKMITGLKAIQELKKTPGASLEQQEVLKSIKAQLRQISQQLSGQPAPPTPPPQPPAGGAQGPTMPRDDTTGAHEPEELT